MRLFEFTDRFANDLATLLRNRIGEVDKARSNEILTYPALSNLLAPEGYGEIRDDQDLSNILDQNPELKTYIADFDENGITLATKDQIDNPPSKMDIPSAPSVDQMAHQGASAHLKNISK